MRERGACEEPEVAARENLSPDKRGGGPEPEPDSEEEEEEEVEKGSEPEQGGGVVF